MTNSGHFTGLLKPLFHWRRAPYAPFRRRQAADGSSDERRLAHIGHLGVFLHHRKAVCLMGPHGYLLTLPPALELWLLPWCSYHNGSGHGLQPLRCDSWSCTRVTVHICVELTNGLPLALYIIQWTNESCLAAAGYASSGLGYRLASVAPLMVLGCAHTTSDRLICER